MARKCQGHWLCNPILGFAAISMYNANNCMQYMNMLCFGKLISVMQWFGKFFDKTWLNKIFEMSLTK